MAEADDRGIEIDDTAFAVLRDMLAGKRRDYAKIADELGFAPEDVARGIVRALRSAASPGDVRVLVERLGVETSDVLKAAEAQGPDTLAAVVRNLNSAHVAATPSAVEPATPVRERMIRGEAGTAAAVIASAVLAQWVIAWGVLSLPDRAGLARLDWWQSMTHALLGHNAPTVIEIAALKKWMTELRQRTGGKPVTTTAPLVSYLGERGQPLREIGDWYFPDVRGPWVYGAPPEKLMEELQQAVREVTTLPPDRPVLLKMISCPAGPEPRYSPQAQAEFYRWLQRDLYLPSGVSPPGPGQRKRRRYGRANADAG
jgi:hypothetical protein